MVPNLYRFTISVLAVIGISRSIFRSHYSDTNPIRFIIFKLRTPEPLRLVPIHVLISLRQPFESEAVDLYCLSMAFAHVLDLRISEGKGGEGLSHRVENMGQEGLELGGDGAGGRGSRPQSTAAISTLVRTVLTRLAGGGAKALRMAARHRFTVRLGTAAPGSRASRSSSAPASSPWRTATCSMARAQEASR